MCLPSLLLSPSIQAREEREREREAPFAASASFLPFPPLPPPHLKSLHGREEEERENGKSWFIPFG